MKGWYTTAEAAKLLGKAAPQESASTWRPRCPPGVSLGLRGLRQLAGRKGEAGAGRGLGPAALEQADVLPGRGRMAWAASRPAALAAFLT